MTPPDGDLIARVLAEDDRDAFGELVKRHQSVVRAFLRRLTRGDIGRADDLAQETFLQAYHSLDKFRGSAAFLTWVLGIAYNRFRNDRRKQRDVLPDSVIDSAEPTSTPGNHTFDLKHDIARALESLTPDEQAALHLHFERGLSHREIADALAWPLGTVKTHLARAKEKLRPLLSAWNPIA